MFSTVLTQVTGLFDSGKEFPRTYFFPSLAWMAGMAAIVVGSQAEVERRLEQFQDLDAVLQVAWIAAGLTLVAVVASILASVRRSTLRLFEGYWPRWTNPLKRKLVATHLSYLESVRDRNPARFDRLVYFEYPHPEVDARHVMPTRLGNILKSAERYPYWRYGADAVLLWPRLFPMLDEDFRKQVDAAQRSVDFGITIALLSSTFGWLGGALMYGQGRNWLWFVAVFVGPIVLAALSYRAALAAAVSYGELVRSSFDLYRMKLLERLGLQAEDELDPRKPLESQELWKALGQFVFRAWPELDRRPWPPPAAKETSPTRHSSTIEGSLLGLPVDLRVSGGEEE